MTDALGGETEYEYDVMGRTTSVTDAEGNATRRHQNYTKGMHTVMVRKESGKFIVNNFVGNRDISVDRIADLLNYGGKKREFVCAYIISNRFLADDTVSV